MGVCCERVKCLPHKWKRKSRLAHLWPEHCLMMALPLYTLAILRFSPQKDDSSSPNVDRLFWVQSSHTSHHEPRNNKCNQAPRKPTWSYVNNPLTPKSKPHGFPVSSAVTTRITCDTSVSPESACISEAMLIHLIQRTGCFQACGAERKRFMWVWVCAGWGGERVGEGGGDREGGVGFPLQPTGAQRTI